MAATLVFVVAGGGFLAWRQARAMQTQALADWVQASAGQIQGRVRDLTVWVEGLGKDPRLWAALSQGEADREAQRLAEIVPAAVKVHLLPKAADRPELGFADLDLVRQAESGDPPPAVHGFGSPEAHLAVARAIRQENRVLGVILVGIRVDWLQALVPTPSRGAVALWQGNLQLAYRGDPKFQSQPPSGIVPIPNTLWQLKFWTSPPDWTVLGGNLALLGMALLGTFGLLGLIWRKCAQAIAQDCAALGGLVNDLLAGTVRGNYALSLHELKPLLERLLEAQRAARTRQTPPPQEIAPKPPEALPSEQKGRSQDQGRTAVAVPASLFRSEAIFGLAESLTPAVAYELGRALGSEAGALGEQRVAVGCDARPASGEVARALIEGLRASGRDVIDLGKVPAPLVDFAVHCLPVRSGVMVSGSHHPPPYTGLKVVLAQRPWGGEELKRLRQRLEAGDLAAGLGMLESWDLVADYIAAVLDDVQLARPLKVIVDCGGGVAGQVAPALLRALGCTVEESHTRGVLDPLAPGALERLRAKVQKDPEAELGLAFDGDGARLAVVDSAGNWVPPDQVLMLLAADVLSRQPGGDIVFDVECGRQLAGYIIQHGGRPVLAPSGDRSLWAKMAEVGAVLGGGGGGQLLFQERWLGVADAIYGAARLLEVLALEPIASAEIFSGLPKVLSTPQLRLALPEDQAEQIAHLLAASADKFFHDAKVQTLDGVRVDFAEGWGLVRPSHTVSALVFRFEADSPAALARIQARFREWFEVLELPQELPFAVGE
ncbi:phosphomannomutase/phosphoglucomutase [Methylothermus subterraneus]